MMHRIVLLAVFLIGICAAKTHAQDDAEFQLAKGRQIYQNNCLMCHAAPIVASQRLTREQWNAETTKMIGWGAPIAEDEREPLVDFLTKSYGVEIPKVRPSRITIRTAEAAIGHQNDEGDVNTLTGDLTRGKLRYVEHCAKCHGSDAAGGELGTSLLRRPILGRWSDFRVIVRDGRNRMPGFRQAIDKSAETDILWWLDSLSNEPSPARTSSPDKP